MALGAFCLAWLLVPGLSRGTTAARSARFVRFGLVSVAGGMAGALWSVDRTELRRAFTGLYATGPLAFARDALQNLGPGAVWPNPGRWPSPITELLGIAFLVFFCLGLLELWKGGRRDLAALLFFAASVPLLLKYVTLGPRAGWDWARYATPALLPFLAAAGIGLDWCRRRLRRLRLQVLAAGFLAVALLPASLDPYRRDEYEEWKAIAAHLEHGAPSLAGILFLPVDWRQPGPADLRITDIHHLVRKEALPRYHLSDWRIEKLELVPSRGAITLLPRPSGPPLEPLASGRYAVLSRRPLSDCGEIARRLRGIRVDRWSSQPVSKGLTLCDFEFAG
jgi:hypothetical protein